MKSSASERVAVSSAVATRSRDRLRRSILLVGVALLAAAAWWGMAPTAIGGQSSYVVTQGNSMLPTYEADGVVVTREQAEYDVGDVVAYRNGELDAVVMHRIVARDGDRYVLQGDNNDFLDSYRPVRSEIVGEERVYLPEAGRYLRYLRDPLHFALIIGGIALLSVRLPRVNRRRRHHGR